MLVHWLWLATRKDISDWDKQRILSCFSDAEEVYYADKTGYQQIEELSEKAFSALMDKDLTQAREILRDCEDLGIQVCTYQDAAYPGRLKNIADPPLVLYYKGRLPNFDEVPVIGVVGTRKCTPYGIYVARKMGGQITRCGGLIVSGIAKGIDGAAMSGALSAGGMAVGVLGNGADVIYPMENKALYADTQAHGCLLTEFPPKTPPYGWNFPKRNRLISGLSNGVLVVEAPKVSGALITVRQAAEQGRDVFVVPGNVDMESCEGSNALLREGAISVTRGWDVVSEYQHLYPHVVRPDDSVITPAGYTDAVMSKAVVQETSPPRVAQKTVSAENSSKSARKKEKIPIDNAEKPAYSDIQDILQGLTEEERTVASLLLNGEMLVDDVIAKSGLFTAKVLATLTVLEIKSVVKRLPGKRVCLKSY